MEYDQAARKRLGAAVRAARVSAGFRKRDDFAAAVHRSARQVQALENGETGVGPDTIAAVARKLGWNLDDAHALLENRGTTGVGSTVLADVSDEELAAEVLRRMRGDDGGNTAPTITLNTGPEPDVSQ